MFFSSNYLGNTWSFFLPLEFLDQFDKLGEKKEHDIQSELYLSTWIDILISQSPMTGQIIPIL